jgi:DNA-binding protein HU-beta
MADILEEPMNRTDLVAAIAEETGLSTALAGAALTACLDAIAGAVAAGGAVTLPGFGSFEARQRAARSGRNPQTGAPIEIAASTAPAFKPAAAFKRLVSEA